MNTTLECLSDYLIAEALVRNPRVAGPLPTLWLEPDDGVPSPGEGANVTETSVHMVLGAFRSTGIAPRRMEKFLRTDGVEIIILATKAYRIHEFEPLLRAALHDKTQWVMGGLLLHYSEMVRDIQRLGVSESGVHAYTTEYMFEMWET